MIGVAFGVDSSYAVYAGFLLHMITGVIIGIIYCTLYQNIKKLLITSVYKGLGTGICYRSSSLGNSFSSTKLWNNAANITQYGKYTKL